MWGLLRGWGTFQRRYSSAMTFLLVALVGGAAVADEDAAVGLDLAAGEQAGAGDGDERVAGGDDARWSSGRRHECSRSSSSRRVPGRIEAGAVEQIVRRVEEEESS